MKRKSLKSIVVLLLALSLLCASAITAFAANDLVIDFAKKGSVSITLRSGEEGHPAVGKGSFRLYHVATATSRNHNLHFVYTEPFRDNGMTLDDVNQEGFADHLAAYAQQQKLEYQEADADKEGTATFAELELGLYLVVQEGSVRGYYPVAPFLVSVPMTNADGTSWIYDIAAAPKVQKRPGSPSGGDTSITVEKVWEDGGENRPDSVTVALMHDGEVYKTTVLSEENDWKYTWSRLDTHYSWTVAEIDVPEGYTVSYADSGRTTVITNAEEIYIPEEPIPGGPGPGENIPEAPLPEAPEDPEVPPMLPTGQLNWPIPVLAGAGLLVFAAGWMMTFTKKEKDHEA